MYSYVIKINRYKGQTRITIPKVVALLTGIDKAKVIELTVLKDKSIKIEVYHGEKGK